MKTYLNNAFSINMIDGEFDLVEFHRISAKDAAFIIEEARKTNEFDNQLGHADICTIVNSELREEGLDINLTPYRGTCKLRQRKPDDENAHSKGDRLIVAQYTGPRLPEGVTKLPSSGID